MARRANDVYCDECRPIAEREAEERFRQEQAAVRATPPRTLVCIDCGAEFMARRSDALRCQPCYVKNRTAIEKRSERKYARVCPDCGTPVTRKSSRCRVCDGKYKSDVGSVRGENNPNWKGGRGLTEDGYIRVLAVRPGKKHRYQPEHIVVWEQTQGKPLPQGWVVHHLNGVKTDNRPENLLGTPRHEHHKHPREALVPYEERIHHLEARLRDAGLPID